MNAAEFRKLALNLPEASEAEHMNHPDFRVRGKIFATLGYPNQGCGVVKLTPQEQQRFVNAYPDVFVPCNGSWGKRGATTVVLKGAAPNVVRRALINAWCNTAPKTLVRQMKDIVEP